MDDIARREAQTWLRIAKESFAEAREEAARAIFGLRYVVKANVCGVVGHRWGAWEDSTSLFAPPERRRCSRCGGKEFRGTRPAVKPVFVWHQDQI